ncbi:RNA-binding protein 34-like [Leguminivora glycinivorella]|uniref:RNA-binding protein 34-like n=1 Tax=Leguminivora glycinivorella TaxID=1035111 RepID=UPI00200F1902|nr:RNA-binding protein 34-like [Leguminivora glycinivorella]XP_048002077.1 RNA-binding protein 34-like [Leguminivora glycinivorella]
MGEPQSRKRKFKGNSKPDNKAKDVGKSAEDINKKPEVTKVFKKAKKNKVIETPAVVNENDTNEIETENVEKMEVVETSNAVDKPSKQKNKKGKKNKAKDSGDTDNEVVAKKAKMSVVTESSETVKGGLTEEMLEKYPVLKDEELVKRFLAVSMTNNQKGRIRVTLRDSLKGTSDAMLPEVINTKMQAILNLPDPSDSDMRKLRILYNMLKTAVKGKKFVKKEPVKVKEVKKKENKEVKEESAEDSKKEKKPEQKVKGPKRYVVFIGNLPLDISKEKIQEHFSDLSSQIVGVRIPKPLESKKSAIAYLELKDETSYELALSKHHSMLENRRINVLYSTQKNSKISKTEAKGKAAKLVAMQKSGQLAGSVPQNKKRSARRKKMKLALKAQEGRA